MKLREQKLSPVSEIPEQYSESHIHPINRFNDLCRDLLL